MDKRWIITIIPAILISSACLVVSGLGKVVRGSGQVTSETRTARGFDRISVCCGMRLMLTQGDTESLEIEADDNLLPEIVTEVQAGELIIRYLDTNGQTQYRPSQPVRVRVGAIDIHGLDISGGGSLEVEVIETGDLDIVISGGSRAKTGAITAERLKVEVSGGGDFSAQDLQLTALDLNLSGGSAASLDTLEAESLKLESSGGGDITAAGSVAAQDIQFSGGSSYAAGDLESDSVTISMSGGGEATLWVNQALQADLSGGARVDYYGRPLITEQVSGGSKLVSLGER
jgi:hypothetical protein